MIQKIFTISAILVLIIATLGTISAPRPVVRHSCLAPELKSQQVDETSQLANVIMDAIAQSAKSPLGTERIIYTGPEVEKNNPATQQFLFFLKPNATTMDFDKAAPRSNNPVIEALKMLKSCGIPFVINEIRIYSGKAILNAKLITQHYGAIGFRAMHGRESLEAFRSTIKDKFKIDLDEFAVYGGVEILGKTFDGKTTPITTEDLSQLCTKDGFDSAREEGMGGRSTKIAPGTYFVVRTDKKIDGKPVIIVNGFHPSQIDQYCSPENKVLVAFALSFDKSALDIEQLKEQYGITTDDVSGALQIIRDWIIGFTKPHEAYPGSFRRNTFDNWQALGMDAQPNMADNSAHFSAGPIEAMRELRLWAGLNVRGTSMGQLLLKNNIPERLIIFLMESEPKLFSLKGKNESIFDATEGMDVSQETVDFILHNKTMPRILADYIAGRFSAEPLTTEFSETELDTIADIAVVSHDNILVNALSQAVEIIKQEHSPKYDRFYRALVWFGMEHIADPSQKIERAA